MTLETILRRTILVGIFSIPFIPFIVAPSMFFPFITGKSFAFRIIAEIIFAAWIILMFLNASYRPRFSWIFVSMAAFLAVMTLADLLGVRPFKSFWSNFERMEGLVTLIHLAMYTLVAGTVLKTEKLWERLFQTSVGASVVISLFGLLQLAGVFTINQGGDRLDATFGNATYLAIYMLFHIFLVAFLMARSQNVVMRWVLAAILPLQALILFFTGTRGTILGLIGGVTLAALIAFITSKKKAFRYAAIGTIVGIIAIIGGFIAIKDTSFVQDNYTLGRFADISLDAGAARFQVWNMAWQGFQERPLLGWGQENFNFVFNKYYQPEMFAQEPWFDRVHNIFLDWLIAGGILGLIAYLALPGSFLYYLWIRRSKTSSLSFSERGILTGLLGGYFVSLLFVFDNIVSYLLFFTILAYVYSVSNRTLLQPEEPNTVLEQKNTALVAVAPVVLIVLATSLYFVNIRAIVVSSNTIQGLSQQETITENADFFKRAYAANTIGRQEVAEQFVQTAIQLRTNNDFANEELNQFFIDAGLIMQQEINISKNDPRLNILMASMLMTYGLQNESMLYIQDAIAGSPTKQQLLFKLGEYHINQQEFDEAVQVFKETFELAPEFDLARILYATALVHSGDIAGSDQVLQEKFDDNFFLEEIHEYPPLLNAYVSVGRFDKALTIREAAVRLNPTDVQARLSLAATLVILGNDVGAIAEIETAIELDPSFKNQGEEFIRQIRSGEIQVQ